MIRCLRHILCLISISLIAGTGIYSIAQQSKHDQPISDELYKLVEKKADLVKQEISDAEDRWSGTYFAGDHHPTMFMWSPNSFLVTSSHHTFSPSWVNYGKISFNGVRLAIYPELPKENTSAHLMENEFMALLWGEQRFLVPPKELLAFAYAVHSRDESLIVEYFSNSADREKSRRGLPNLPSEYTKYLKMSPIVARITAVEHQDRPWPTLSINAGRRSGIIEGMQMYYVSKSGIQLRVRVTEVSENVAKAEVSLISSNGSSEDIKIQPGWKLTSRAPKSFIGPG